MIRGEKRAIRIRHDHAQSVSQANQLGDRSAPSSPGRALAVRLGALARDLLRPVPRQHARVERPADDLSNRCACPRAGATARGGDTLGVEPLGDHRVSCSLRVRLGHRDVNTPMIYTHVLNRGPRRPGASRSAVPVMTSEAGNIERAVEAPAIPAAPCGIPRHAIGGASCKSAEMLGSRRAARGVRPEGAKRGEALAGRGSSKLVISQPTLNRLENSGQNTTLRTLTQLCRALRCEPGDPFTPGRLRLRRHQK